MHALEHTNRWSPFRLKKRDKGSWLCKTWGGRDIKGKQGGVTTPRELTPSMDYTFISCDEPTHCAAISLTNVAINTRTCTHQIPLYFNTLYPLENIVYACPHIKRYACYACTNQDIVITLLRYYSSESCSGFSGRASYDQPLGASQVENHTLLLLVIT